MAFKTYRNIILILILVICAAAFAAVILRENILQRFRGYRELDQNQIEKAVADNEYYDPEKQKLVEAALSLVGKVKYFWGGKYNAVGMNPDWGELREVTSPGNSESGKLLPLGLDCSGYVSWCFIQLDGDEKENLNLIGEGTWNQWFNSTEVAKEEVRLGDLAFENAYPGAKSNHVGIIVGFLNNGEMLIAHCNPSANTVVVSTCGGSFSYFRRPAVFGEQSE